MTKRGAVVVASTDRTIPDMFQGKLEPNYYCRGWNSKRSKYCRSRAGQGTSHKGIGRCFLHGGQKIDGDARVKGARYSTVNAERIGALITSHLQDEDPLNVLPEIAAARALFQDFVERYEELTAALTAWHDTWDGRRIPIALSEKAALLALIDEHELLLKERDDPTDRQAEQLELARAAVAFLATEQAPKPRKIVDISDAVGHLDVISKMVARVEQARATNAISRPELLRVMTEMGRVVQAHVTDPDILNRIRDGWLTIRL